jgi:hypothetical protein
MKLVLTIYLTMVAAIILVYPLHNGPRVLLGRKLLSWPWSAVLFGLLWPVLLLVLLYAMVTGKDHLNIELFSWPRQANVK